MESGDVEGVYMSLEARDEVLSKSIASSPASNSLTSAASEQLSAEKTLSRLHMFLGLTLASLPIGAKPGGGETFLQGLLNTGLPQGGVMGGVSATEPRLSHFSTGRLILLSTGLCSGKAGLLTDG